MNLEVKAITIVLRFLFSSLFFSLLLNCFDPADLLELCYCIFVLYFYVCAQIACSLQSSKSILSNQPKKNSVTTAKLMDTICSNSILIKYIWNHNRILWMSMSKWNQNQIKCTEFQTNYFQNNSSYKSFKHMSLTRYLVERHEVKSKPTGRSQAKSNKR